jgi:hypothetical protein
VIRRGLIVAALAGLLLAGLLFISGFPPALIAAWREEAKEHRGYFPTVDPLPFGPRPSGPQPLSMADPGQPYNRSCITDRSIPMSRLILAGCNARRCFVEYETDGYGHNVQVIGFSTGQTPHLLWFEYIGHGGESLKSLRAIAGPHWSLVTGA